MKIKKITYWISTVLVTLIMIYSSYSDLCSEAVEQAFIHLGFPGYFRIELGVMKIIGIVILLFPLPRFCKEWAYAGFSITFISAFIAHTASSDPMENRLAPLVVLVVLLVSYFSFHKIKKHTTDKADEVLVNG